MKVKICGLTNKDDAVWALNYGADLLGFNFYKESPRHITLASAKKWINELPSFAHKVGVFVNAEMDEIVKTAAALKLKAVQLHGDESPEWISRLRFQLESEGLETKIIKAIRLDEEAGLAVLDSYKDAVDYFLLDKMKNGQFGGTGESFDWALAEKAASAGKPVLIAGGLTPDNVREAVKKGKPFGVDVASGVEKSPRKKDLNLVKRFIENARS